MRKLFTFAYTFFVITAFAQKSPTEEAQPIVAEGKRLYRSEMASWYGTDLFLEKYKNMQNIGGYFSYADKDLTKCVFFSRSEQPKIIGTVSFDSSFEIETAKLDLSERDFTSGERDIYLIRQKALEEINSDDMFKTYDNANLNLIPMISDNERKVYVLTGPKQHGVIILGNDYLLAFDQNNELVSKKQLHKNIIPINYETKETGQQIEGAMHSHLPETGDFITATDICTLMLYQKFAKWKTHQVVSKNYLNIWNCETNELNVIPMSTIEKINKDQKKKDRK